MDTGLRFGICSISSVSAKFTDFEISSKFFGRFVSSKSIDPRLFYLNCFMLSMNIYDEVPSKILIPSDNAIGWSGLILIIVKLFLYHSYK